MLSLSYDKIFSRVLNKINDPKELSLDESDLYEIYTERLHSVVGDPRVRRMFSSLSLDDIIQTLTCTLNHPVDDEADTDFVIEILSLGITIEWLKPQVDSILNSAAMIGGKEEKKILDNHRSMIDRLDHLEIKKHKMIRDYGFMYNPYVSGD